MLNQLKTLFQSAFVDDNPTENQANRVHSLNLACAALLIEVATIDNHFDKIELEALKNQLMRQFSIHDNELEELVKLATQEQKNATSTYQFTQLINEHCDDNQKLTLIKSMWVVAYADGNIDKFEEHIIRKVADLIYVPHAQFIKAKIEARKTSTNN